MVLSSMELVNIGSDNGLMWSVFYKRSLGFRSLVCVLESHILIYSQISQEALAVFQYKYVIWQV